MANELLMTIDDVLPTSERKCCKSVW